MDRTIEQHIDSNKNEIENPSVSSQRRRHLQDELTSLETYKGNHPNDNHGPTPMELFCDANPNFPECKFFEV